MAPDGRWRAAMGMLGVVILFVRLWPGSADSLELRMRKKRGKAPKVQVSRKAQRELKQRKHEKRKIGNEAWRQDPGKEVPLNLLPDDDTEPSSEKDYITPKKDHKTLRGFKKKQEAFSSKAFAEMRGFYLKSNSEEDSEENGSALKSLPRHGVLSNHMPTGIEVEITGRKRLRHEADEASECDSKENDHEIRPVKKTDFSELTWKETVNRVKAGQLSVKVLSDQLKNRALSMGLSYEGAAAAMTDSEDEYMERMRTMKGVDVADDELQEMVKNIERKMMVTPMFLPKKTHSEDEDLRRFEEESAIFYNG